MLVGELRLLRDFDASRLNPRNDICLIMNRSLHLLICLIFFTACAPTPVVPTQTDPPPTLPAFTSTIVPIVSPESTSTSFVPSLTPTQIPCDPFVVGFCITEGHFILQRPILPPANDSVDRTYPYASTAGGTRDPHHGVEFVNRFGTPVHAAADGIVIFAGPDTEATYSPWRDYYGNLVVIRHDDDLYTLYAHLSKITVEAGKRIQAGDQIGEVGQSGVAIGSHLHFEVRRGDVEDFFSTVNPELWLVPTETGFGALAVTLQDGSSNSRRETITLQYYPLLSGFNTTNYYFDAYAPALIGDGENAAISDLPPGQHRITLIHNGHLYERWVDVESGKLTQAVIIVE